MKLNKSPRLKLAQSSESVRDLLWKEEFISYFLLSASRGSNLVFFFLYKKMYCHLIQLKHELFVGVD